MIPINATDRVDALIAEYIRAAKRRNLSAQTVRNYERTLSLYSDYLADNRPNGEYVDYCDITAYSDYLSDRGNKMTSVKQTLVVLNQFFTFATKPYISAELRYDHSPVSPDFYPKTKQEQIGEILPDCAVAKLWENRCLYKDGPHKYFPRNYAITVLILATGLRNKEVLDLTLDDLHFTDEYSEIAVRHGKGDKYRIVDAPDIVVSAVELYLASGLRPLYLTNTAPLFGTTASHDNFGGIRNGEAYHRGTTQWLSELIERHVYQQTGFHNVRSHDLRHLFARATINTSGNLAELQSMMGHSSPLTTERYSQRVQNRRKRASYQAVISARDEAAKKNFALLEQRDGQLSWLKEA